MEDIIFYINSGRFYLYSTACYWVVNDTKGTGICHVHVPVLGNRLQRSLTKLKLYER